MTDLKTPPVAKLKSDSLPPLLEPPYGTYHYDDSFDLFELGRSIYRDRWLVLCIVAVATLVALFTAFTAVPIYRAEALLAPSVPDKNEGVSTLIGQLGDIAALVGTPAMGTKDRTQESIATLKSRSLAMDFIREQNLKPKLFPAIWDDAGQAWRAGSKVPTDLEAYQTFDAQVRTVNVDRRNGLVSLIIEWSDPELAALWANRLVLDVNKRRQSETIHEAQQSVKYLQQQLARNGSVEIQQAIYRLIEAQTKTIALASAREDYAFRVIDPAIRPERPIRPRRLQMVVAGLAFGLIIAFGAVLVRRVIAKGRALVKPAV